MKHEDIAAIIKQGQQLKRMGQVAEALTLEKRLLATCKTDRTEDLGLAIIYKSIAKLFYIQGAYPEAQQSYLESIRLFRRLGIKDQEELGQLHLGSCAPAFQQSPYLKPYVESLRGQPAEIPSEVYDWMLELGSALVK